MSTNSSSVGSSSVGSSSVGTVDFCSCEIDQKFLFSGDSQSLGEFLRGNLTQVFSSYVQVFRSLRHVYEGKCEDIADTLSYLITQNCSAEVIEDQLRQFTNFTVSDIDFVGSSRHHLAAIIYDKEKDAYVLMPQTYGVKLTISFSHAENLLRATISVETPENESFSQFQQLRKDLIDRTAPFALP